MIELTDQQMQLLENPATRPLRVVNPRTMETFVLLSIKQYQELLKEYDAEPWTSEERHALAWEARKHAGWEGMDEYDCIPDQS